MVAGLIIQNTRPRFEAPRSKQCLIIFQKCFFVVVFCVIVVQYTCVSINITLQSQVVFTLSSIQEVPGSKLSQIIGILKFLFVLSLSPCSTIVEQKAMPSYNRFFRVISNQLSLPDHSTLYTA